MDFGADFVRWMRMQPLQRAAGAAFVNGASLAGRMHGRLRLRSTPPWNLIQCVRTQTFDTNGSFQCRARLMKAAGCSWNST